MSAKELKSLTKQLVSTANWLIFISIPSTMIPLMLSFSLMLIASNSTVIINKYAEIGHPCLTPCFG